MLYTNSGHTKMPDGSLVAAAQEWSQLLGRRAHAPSAGAHVGLVSARSSLPARASVPPTVQRGSSSPDLKQGLNDGSSQKCFSLSRQEGHVTDVGD